MKQILNIIKLVTIALVLSTGFILPANAQKKNKEQIKEEKAAYIQKLLEGKNYKIFVDYMLPMSERSRSLTSPYWIEVKNDTLISQLPYIGRAYSIPYGGGKGLNFEAPITNYTSEPGKKGRTNIEFTSKNDEDTYTYIITIYKNGFADVHVQPIQRQSISYRGKISIDSDEENQEDFNPNHTNNYLIH